jgi:hypothetical protein
MEIIILSFMNGDFNTDGERIKVKYSIMLWIVVV